MTRREQFHILHHCLMAVNINKVLTWEVVDSREVNDKRVTIEALFGLSMTKRFKTSCQDSH